jgi:hypothetical protein
MIAERVNSSCDMGRSPSELQVHNPTTSVAARGAMGARLWLRVKPSRCVDLFGCQAEFPEYDFSDLGDNWWLQGTDALDPPELMEPRAQFHQRIAAFKTWLQARPESDICLVCHSVVIHSLLGKWVANCELSVCMLDKCGSKPTM